MGAALRMLTDDELELYCKLLDLAKGSPEQVKVNDAARVVGDRFGPGAIEWFEALDNHAHLWPTTTDAPRREWAAVPFTPPPPVPAMVPGNVLRAARGLPPGLERDAHLVAAVSLAIVARL